MYTETILCVNIVVIITMIYHFIYIVSVVCQFCIQLQHEDLFELAFGLSKMTVRLNSL